MNEIDKLSKQAEGNETIPNEMESIKVVFRSSENRTHTPPKYEDRKVSYDDSKS